MKVTILIGAKRTQVKTDFSPKTTETFGHTVGELQRLGGYVVGRVAGALNKPPWEKTKVSD